MRYKSLVLRFCPSRTPSFCKQLSLRLNSSEQHCSVVTELNSSKQHCSVVTELNSSKQHCWREFQLSLSSSSKQHCWREFQLSLSSSSKQHYWREFQLSLRLPSSPDDTVLFLTSWFLVGLTWVSQQVYTSKMKEIFK